MNLYVMKIFKKIKKILIYKIILNINKKIIQFQIKNIKNILLLLKQLNLKIIKNYLIMMKQLKNKNLYYNYI